MEGAPGGAAVATLEDAAGDANVDGTITVDEILTAVNNTLSGCPALPVVGEFRSSYSHSSSPRISRTQSARLPDPSRCNSTARRPQACAPARSSFSLSPTCSASDAATPRRCSATLKILGSGLAAPARPDITIASNRCAIPNPSQMRRETAVEVRNDRQSQPASAQLVEPGDHVVKELPTLRPARSGQTAPRRRHRSRRSACR